ncbi:amidohydrolase family protein [Sinomicrobium weinanense]|uniref:Amidohydrolase family protein n=1 Tax=Sinomicrobium weinanense TaxID=2842200 RepID=A0A926Q3E8_9FLAO|nr:amidohydrolase family protein [Sinomicrobium weinanense]MBC9795685.1 amidohydrolase family protein [Sinomicrobium weinanense]MBU3122854.1 amidohydrolase family protein [Sinomicrobium weinanense]
MRKRLPVLLLVFLCSITLHAQEYFPKNDGVKTTDNNYTAFTNARIYVTPTQVIDNGTLLIQKGKVVAAGNGVSVPDNSQVIDLKGKHIYPSFIDMYSEFGVQKPAKKGRGRRSPQYDASRKGFYWNDHIMPEKNAVDKFLFDTKKARELLQAGFGTVNTHVADGIVRGTSVLVALDSTDNSDMRIIGQKAAQHFSFAKSVASAQNYPTSLMGAMALLRQMYRDAKWYAAGHAENKDMSLEALNANKDLPQIFDADGYQNDLRASRIAKEFGLQYILKGGGDEYQRIREIKATGASFILPLDFPEAYDVSDPNQAGKVALSDMRLWNQAPGNPAALAKNDIPFAFTLAGLKKTADFKANLMKAIDYGLDKTKALEALTTIPAGLLGKSEVIGSLKNGSYANFLITSGDIFDKKTTLYENWVQGDKHTINDMSLIDVRGEYDLAIGGNTYKLKITGEPAKPKAELKSDTTTLKTKLTYSKGWFNLAFSPKKEGDTGFVRLNSLVTAPGSLSGKAILANGTESTWRATKKSDYEKKDKDDKKDEKTIPEMVPLTFPNNGYGFAQLPKQENILFKNATVWTSEDEGILENTDVLVKNGKIARVGKNLSAGGAKVIDATGKHLTAGIIDEHSHIAATSINESGHNSSAEVSIEDVVDGDDINIYRNLSGGVTSIQILHGSANPIGGRSAIIKLKWGLPADQLIYENSPKFIKFALGENVKQSNWGDLQTIRFPQSRMGVEQVYMDYFQRAKEYDAKKKSGKPYRFDYEMETLAEIINKERFITCHSYVQSEINMLMKVVERFDFNINTFTHILEGYKVADKMKEHGVVGASTFSDWWAYKYEVNDAIPYNAAIMQSQGLNVAINSDDAEMSRRLNQEAGKTVKYGGVSEEEAWKMVTINPAKMLHLDQRVGSIKAGKDADLVLWSDHPLSIYAIAEKTFIEGVPYYDYENMKQRQQSIAQERNRLINQMLEAKNKGEKTQAPKKKEDKHFHCDTEVYGI